LSDDGVAFLHHSNLGSYSINELAQAGEFVFGRSELMAAEKMWAYVIILGWFVSVRN